jgi:hypothetical protein
VAELKTKPTDESVTAFLNGITDESRRSECLTIVKLMKKATRSAPKMWGPSIIGFGDYRCRYPSGRELDWFMVGFSPRKQALTLYLMGQGRSADLLKKLGKYKTGKSCLYIKSLQDIDLAVLSELVKQTVKNLINSPAGEANEATKPKKSKRK